MLASEMTDVTRILQAAGRGDRSAPNDLLPLDYDGWRKIPAVQMARESPGQTLQPTALVHEAWLRMMKDEDQTWQNQSFFFHAAAEAMRRILIELAELPALFRYLIWIVKIKVDRQ